MVAATLLHYICAFTLKTAPGFEALSPSRHREIFYLYLKKLA